MNLCLSLYLDASWMWTAIWTACDCCFILSHIYFIFLCYLSSVLECSPERWKLEFTAAWFRGIVVTEFLYCRLLLLWKVYTQRRDYLQAYISGSEYVSLCKNIFYVETIHLKLILFSFISHVTRLFRTGQPSKFEYSFEINTVQFPQ